MRLLQSFARLLAFYLFCGFLLTLVTSLLPSHAAAQQLVSSPGLFGFGGVVLGKRETQLAVLTNTGQTAVTVTAITSSDSEFLVSGVSLPMVIPAQDSVALSLVFTPSNFEWKHGTITVTSDASNPTLDIRVAGLGLSSAPITASPASLSFGQVAVGVKITASLVLTNDRAWSKTLYSVAVTGSAFKITGATFPVVIPPGKSVTLAVDFAPKTAGLTSGRIFFYGPGLNIPLEGTGTTGTTTGQLSVSPGSLNFGNVDVGATTSATSAFTATGGSVTISSVSSNNSQFSVSGTSFPLTLNAGHTANVQLVFSPSKAGAESATLTISSTASDATTTESLTGTGVTVQYSVNLSWQPSTSSVAGYNVYRGTQVGSYSKINPSLDSTTSYTDNTVVSGTTYYYAATAVSSNGQESIYSSPLKVAIP